MIRFPIPIDGEMEDSMKVELGGEARGPLAGVRVVDFSAVVSGPLSTQILGDLGADVIKVEAPHGDTTRRLGPPFKGGMTPLYAHCNRNKRGVKLNLKDPDDLARARELAKEADVVVQNFRPGVAERLGIGYEELSRENPGLVYVSISGFGPDGPYAEQPAYDMLIQALSGLAHELGEPGRPKLVRNLLADKTSALTAAYAAMAALFARERDPEGRGQHVDVPMLDAYSTFGMVDALSHHTFPPVEEGAEDSMLADLYRAWETRDGHVAAAVIEDHQFSAVCRALEREDLLEDPRTANLLTRIQHADDLLAELGRSIAGFTTAELIERARKFEAPLAPVHDVAGFLDDPQVEHDRTVFSMEHRDVGTLRLLSNPVRFGRTPTSVRYGPPSLGEHDDEVLGEE